AGPVRHRRDGRGLGQRLAFAQAFIVEIKEELVLAIDYLRDRQGSAEGRAELIAFEWRDWILGVIEEVFGVQIRIAKKFESAAMHLVGAASCRHVDVACGAAVLGA